MRSLTENQKAIAKLAASIRHEVTNRRVVRRSFLFAGMVHLVVRFLVENRVDGLLRLDP